MLPTLESALIGVFALSGLLHAALFVGKRLSQPSKVASLASESDDIGTDIDEYRDQINERVEAHKANLERRRVINDVAIQRIYEDQLDIASLQARADGLKL